MTTTVHGVAAVPALAGTDLGCTDWVAMSPQRVQTFSQITDAPRADHTAAAHDAGPYGAPVADGFLTLSLVGTLFDRLLHVDGITMTVIYGLNRVRLPHPVKVGDQIRLHAVIERVTAVSGNGVEIESQCTVEIDGVSKPACVASILHRVY